jgi:hypothetical protein
MIIYPEEIMSAKIKVLEADLEKYKKGYDAAMRIVKSVFPDKFPDSYFICGELGVKDNNNMPNKLMVCPAYGLDFFYVYEYTGETAGSEW